MPISPAPGTSHLAPASSFLSRGQNRPWCFSSQSWFLREASFSSASEQTDSLNFLEYLGALSLQCASQTPRGDTSLLVVSLDRSPLSQLQVSGRRPLHVILGRKWILIWHLPLYFVTCTLERSVGLSVRNPLLWILCPACRAGGPFHFAMSSALGFQWNPRQREADGAPSMRIRSSKAINLIFVALPF